MRVFMTKGFARFARSEQIANDVIREAVRRAERGLVDGDLGGGVIKQRLPRPGKGRSGGYRGIIFYRSKDRAIFVDGYAKSSLDNIDDNDLLRYRELAAEFLSFDVRRLQKLVDAGAWIEVDFDG